MAKSSEQCLCAIIKATRTLGLISRTITYKEKGIMVNLYKTLARPHLEYCISSRSPHYAKNKELLEKVQMRFTRMLRVLKGKDYYERLRHLNLWTLEERRNRRDFK